MPPSPESMMDTDKLPLVDVESAPQGRSARGTAAAKKLGWRNQRDEDTPYFVAAPQFKSEDRP